MSDEPEETPPKRRKAGRKIVAYAELYKALKSRVDHARNIITEACDAEPAVCKSLLNIALRTLNEE